MFGSAWACCSPPGPPRYSAPSARSGLHQGSLAKRFEPWHLLCAGWNNLSLADSEKIRESNWLPAANQFNSFPPRGDMSHKASGSAWPIGRRSETCSVVTVAAPRTDRLMMCQSFWKKFLWGFHSFPSSSLWKSVKSRWMGDGLLRQPQSFFFFFYPFCIYSFCWLQSEWEPETNFLHTDTSLSSVLAKESKCVKDSFVNWEFSRHSACCFHSDSFHLRRLKPLETWCNHSDQQQMAKKLKLRS